MIPTTIGDPANKELSLTFFVDPGNRVYVRHIAFNGVNKINDEVLRREMRQLEGGWLSNAALDRSKQRLERLPYIKKVESETKPVAGSTDLVDVTYEIEEGPSAQLGGGVGYSESQSFILSGNYADANFLGTGRRVSIDLNSGRYSKVYGVSMTEPYFTANGVGLTGNVTYRDQTQFVSASSDFSSETIGAGFDIGYPIGKPGHPHGPAVPEVEPAHHSNGSARQAIEWVAMNGDSTRECIDYDTRVPSVRRRAVRNRIQHGRVHDLVELRQPQPLVVCRSRHAAFVRSRLRAAGRQRRRVLRRELRIHQVHPAVRPVHAAVRRRSRLRHGHRRNHGITAVSPVLGGGPETVRGYKESRLGPKDDFGRPFGGNLKVTGRAEVLIPLPQKFETSARLSLFYDMGNIFSTGNRYRSSDLPEGWHRRSNTSFEYDKLKHSTGVAVQWLAPLGVFRFSYACP